LQHVVERQLLGAGDDHGLRATRISPGPNGTKEKRRSRAKTARTARTRRRERPARATAGSVPPVFARRLFIGRRNSVSYARTTGNPQNEAFWIASPVRVKSAVSSPRE